MKIYIVRHGETNYNLKGLCNDSPLDNVFLTNLGIKQASIVAEKLKNDSFDIIYTSEFPRTKHTAKIINQYHNCLLKVDKKLNDNKTGFNGKLVKEYVDELSKYKDFWDIRLKDGESFADVQKRIYSFIEELKTKQYENILIVAHSSTMKFFNGYFSHLSNDEIYNYKNIDNCEVLEFDLN